MKRIISIILIILLTLSLASCKSKAPQEEAFSAGSESENIKQEQQTVKQDTDIIAIDKDDQSSQTENSNEIAENENQQQNGTADESTTQIPETESQSVTESTNSKPQDITDSQTEPKQSDDEELKWIIDTAEPFADIDYGKVETALNYYNPTDCFIAKIIDAEQVILSKEIKDKYFPKNMSEEYSDKHSFILNEDFHSIVYPLNAKLYIYTVEIEKSIFSVFTQEKTSIKVIADVSDMSEEYKVGEKYLMKGNLYQYNGETILRLLDQFKAKVNEDQTLTGLSTDAKIFEQLNTVESFVNDQSIVALFKKDISIPTEFAQGYGVPKYELITSGKHKATLDKLIADGKKAILADSDLKMKIESDAK